MLNRAIRLAAILVLPLCAQTVVPGMGKPPSDYAAAWGRPRSSGEGPFETREQVWTVHRKGGFSGRDFDVHVLFRGERSVEERWLRRGSDPWEKEELWTLLDGKGEKFDLLHQGTALPSPFSVLQTPNTLINFLSGRQTMVAQLQNSLQGPQVLVSSKEWAQAKVDLGLTAKKDQGRLASQAVQSKIRPPWGGKGLNTLVSGLREQAGKAGVRSYATRNGKGNLQITNRKGTRLELVLSDPSAPGDPNRLLQGGQASPAPLKASLREIFRRFHTQANAAVPGLLGGTSPDWTADRIEGAFSDDVLQDLIAMRKLPSEFPLLSWQDPSSGESWDIVVTESGYRLSILWPSGTEPR